MIVVRVELWSAVTGQKRELARMVVDNIGTNDTGSICDYRVRTIRGRDEQTLQDGMVRTLKGTAKPTREGKVTGHARLSLHVWHLVAKALANIGYGN